MAALSFFICNKCALLGYCARNHERLYFIFIFLEKKTISFLSCLSKFKIDYSMQDLLSSCHDFFYHLCFFEGKKWLLIFVRAIYQDSSQRLFSCCQNNFIGCLPADAAYMISLLIISLVVGEHLKYLLSISICDSWSIFVYRYSYAAMKQKNV